MMFSLFKRRSPESKSLTYKERVERFWRWFGEVAPGFHVAIDEGRCADLADVTSRKVNELFPKFAWVYGPGEGGPGHSLTVSGEGVESAQFLALHWLEAAPEIEGWTFHAARQPGSLDSSFEVAGIRFDAKGMWITPDVDEEEERIDVTIWHPEWSGLEDRFKWMVTFLFLDEALGEYGTKWWVGQIRHGNDRLAESFPLSELPEYVARVAESAGWKKHLPGEGHTLFKLEPPPKPFRRGDLMTLSTTAPNLFVDYFDSNGQLEDPLEGSGADYVYVSIPKGFFVPGQEVDQRTELEERLDTALRAFRSGRVLGGGLGIEAGYIDLLIYDGQASLDVVVEALADRNLPRGSAVEFFAAKKADGRVRLG